MNPLHILYFLCLEYGCRPVVIKTHRDRAISVLIYSKLNYPIITLVLGGSERRKNRIICSSPITTIF